MRTVKIDKVLNGFVVEVGCQRLVFETREKLLQELGRYLEKPEEVEKEYAERFGLAGGPPSTPLDLITLRDYTLGQTSTGQVFAGTPIEQASRPTTPRG